MPWRVQRVRKIISERSLRHWAFNSLRRKAVKWDQTLLVRLLIVGV
jgi:hypothetical protein